MGFLTVIRICRGVSCERMVLACWMMSLFWRLRSTALFRVFLEIETAKSKSAWLGLENIKKWGVWVRFEDEKNS